MPQQPMPFFIGDNNTVWYCVVQVGFSEKLDKHYRVENFENVCFRPILHDTRLVLHRNSFIPEWFIPDKFYTGLV